MVAAELFALLTASRRCVTGSRHREDFFFEPGDVMDLNTAILEELTAGILANKRLRFQDSDVDPFDPRLLAENALDTRQLAAETLEAGLDRGVEGMRALDSSRQVLLRGRVLFGQLQQATLFGMRVSRELQGVALSGNVTIFQPQQDSPDAERAGNGSFSELRPLH
ncbi:hypothetical protein Trco_004806 [Trichoderma cornu-damae]|uniref:Uncharacterized protein n=1 Tax=Trichoderma cornu-damae TaxID=654480 RepID=A0A9P8QN11_9HYPO|nr:hypothetical protein Trco_004806 [Trichoderma cornu-damae]